MKRLISGLLTAALCLGSVPTALAVTTTQTVTAGASSDLTSARRADLQTLLDTLAQHPDLYHANSKQVFDAKAAEIRSGLAQMSDVDFALALSELAALAQDSHTKVSIGNVLGQTVRMLPLGVTVVDEGLLLTDVPAACKDVLGGILTAVNGVSMDKIEQALTPMLGGDNQVYRHQQFAQTFYVYEILEHYGVLSSPEDIELTVQQGDRTLTVTVDALTNDALAQLDVARLERTEPSTAADKSKYYFAKPLDARTLYIQYNRCQEDPALPMKTFVPQVQSQLDQGGYDRVILDLRNNGGGSDGVLVPLLFVLEERHKQDGLAFYTLIGAKTFSSALINAVECKQAGATLVGTPTGGSVDHFGAVRPFTLEHSGLQVSCSTKFIDLAPLLPAAQSYDVQPFEPDVLAPQTRADYLVGVDSAVQAILSRTDDAGQPAANLSRGALSVQLGRDYAARTGTALNNADISFGDVCIIAYDAPYISWAVHAGLMLGDSTAVFAPDRPVTRQELAVVLSRYAALCGHPLTADGTVTITDKASIASWAQDAVQALVSRKVLTLTDGAFAPSQTVTPDQADAAIRALDTLMDQM